MNNELAKILSFWFFSSIFHYYQQTACQLSSVVLFQEYYNKKSQECVNNRVKNYFFVLFLLIYSFYFPLIYLFQISDPHFVAKGLKTTHKHSQLMFINGVCLSFDCLTENRLLFHKVAFKSEINFKKGGIFIRHVVERAMLRWCGN